MGAQRTFDCDYVVVGSGFGGSVAALRLSEKGYAVAVLEKGKRWSKEDFPPTNWNLRKYMWLPRLGCYGYQMLTFLKHVAILHGGGVGGGGVWSTPTSCWCPRMRCSIGPNGGLPTAGQG